MTCVWIEFGHLSMDIYLRKIYDKTEKFICKEMITRRAMIFEQPFAYNFYDNLLFLSSYW